MPNMENLNMEYLKKRVIEEVDSIIRFDQGSEKGENLRDLEKTVISSCDIFHLISHDEAVELQKPILEGKAMLNELEFM